MAWCRRLVKNPKGFTLIEIAIVVAIIGLLLMIALPLYSGARVRAYIAEARALTSEWKALTWACLIEKSFDESRCDSSVLVNWTPAQNSGAWQWQSAVWGCGAAASVSASFGASSCASDQTAANAYVAIRIPRQAGVSGLSNDYVLLIETATGVVKESPADGTAVAIP